MFKLVQTCGGCPEQYDVYYQDDKVGYMRLRHGSFYAEYHGNIVYSAAPKGDGIFEWDERDYFLNEACKAIKSAMDNSPESLLFTIETEDR